jgi:hypothetical protein
MVPALVVGVLALLAAFGCLIERRSHRQGAQARTSVLLEQERTAWAASYLCESITSAIAIAIALVHDPHHPGYSGRRR